MASKTVTRKIDFEDSGLANALFGVQNANLNILAEKGGVAIDSRGNGVTISGDDTNQVDLSANVLAQLYGLLKSGRKVYPQDVDCAYGILAREPGTRLEKIFQDEIYAASPRKTIAAKTLSQRDFFDAIRTNDLTFAIGPAGTGKTYLAVAMAAAAFVRKEVKKIILTRPAVEAGEKLGFLPGDMVEKINPYLRPLYDALDDMFDLKKVQEMIDSNLIEIAPLAFMRGRTLHEAFIILDEAQNTTREQMKMFLTRMGFGSKMVVTGDVTQIDLPFQQNSGLVQASGLLQGVKGVGFVNFHEQDVIRHPLVGRIVRAYENGNGNGE